MQVCPLKKCVTETFTLRDKYLKPANTRAPSDFISKPEAEEPQWSEQLTGSELAHMGLCGRL